MLVVVTIIAIWVGWFAWSQKLWRKTERENAELWAATERENAELWTKVESENAERWAKVERENAERFYRTRRANLETSRSTITPEQYEERRQEIDDAWRKSNGDPLPEVP